MLTKLISIVIMLSLGFFSSAVLADDNIPKWLIGTWTPISDEDGTPPDFADFTADGKYINYGYDCSVRTEMSLHIYKGDIYVTGEIPGKGPIAVVFRPDPQGEHLTYTSPRTRNNAVLAKTIKKCSSANNLFKPTP
jgi:hypothetical protein